MTQSLPGWLMHHPSLFLAPRKIAPLSMACILVALATTHAGAQPAQRRAAVPPAPASPVSFTLTGGLGLPAGDLGQQANVGLALGLRGETRLADARWGMRGDVSWDRYDGQGVVTSYQYLALAANLVHHERGGRLYEFGGFGIYHSRVAFVDESSAGDTNLGTQAGIGLQLSDRPPRWFTEFGFTSAFTSGRSSLWFPLRVGLRF